MSNNENNKIEVEVNIGEKGWFRRIAAKANETTNSEGAKKTRKILIISGVIGIALGLVLIVAAIAMLISLLPESPSGKYELPIPRLISTLVLFIGGGILIAVSSMALWAGVSIAVAGVGSKIVDTTDRCPKCGEKANINEDFCDKCGSPILRATLCECGRQNDANSVFCKSCGKKLR